MAHQQPSMAQVISVSICASLRRTLSSCLFSYTSIRRSDVARRPRHFCGPRSQSVDCRRMFDPRHSSLLVLDEDELSLGAWVDALGEIGFPVAVAHSPEDAIAVSQERDFDLVLISLALGRRRVRDLIRQIGRGRRNLPVVVTADPKDADAAVELFNAGIEDYLLHPPREREIRARLGRILEKHELDSHVTVLRDEISKKIGSNSLVSRS